MSRAALVAGWESRYRRWAMPPPGPLAGAAPVGGVPFCPDEFGAGSYLRVRIAFGAVLSNPSTSWSFTDVTTDVMQADGNLIEIAMARLNEQPDAPPASCGLRLDNRQNLYSKNNPLCVNWPNVRNNTPIVVDVTLDGGANWGTLFFGEVTSWQPGWDATGGYAIVDIQAFGRQNRLEQHSQPLASVIRRQALLSTVVGNVAGYWPCEDGSESGQLASGLPNGTPIILSATGSTFASYTGFGGSAPLFVFGSGVNFYGIPDPTVDTTGNLYFRVLLNTPAGIPDGTVLFSLFVAGASSSIDRWNVVYGAGGYLKIDGSVHGGTAAVSTGAIFFGIDNQHYYMSIELVQSGTAVNWLISTDILNADGTTSSSLSTGTFSSTTVGECTAIAGGGSGNMTGCAMGHIGVANTQTWLFASADLLTGYIGETPASRMSRICSEQGVDFLTVGVYNTDTTMGPQSVDSFMNVMRECATTDSGFLYDGLRAGFRYQGISQRYDQETALTLDVTNNEILPTFKPIDDDLRMINKVTVNRKNGSSAVAEKTDGQLGTGDSGIGVIDGQITVNTEDDSRLFYRANWEVHAGTIMGFRYPLVPLNLRANPSVARNWMNRTDGFTGPVVPGCRLDILNISTWATQHPTGTVSLVMEGWTMRLTNLMWELDLVCTTNDKYDVFKVEDTQLGRLQTPGWVLTQDAPMGVTSIVVRPVSSGWSTITTANNPGDFPIYLEVDGIRLTSTSCVQGGNRYQFFIDPATVTKPLLSGTAVKVWHTGVIKF